MSASRSLKFDTEADVLAEISRLRAGYTQTGKWTLPQICWHLEIAMRLRMVPGPFPPNTPEQNANRSKLENILAGEKLPAGIQAPDPALPPEDATDASIDALLATIDRFESFKDPFAPHRIFGNLTDAEARKLNLIHCAHHLSYLVPQS